MAEANTTMFVDLRPGEVLYLDGVVNIELIRKSGNLVRLRIHAPLVVSIQKKNIEPANSRDKDARVNGS